VCAGGSAARTHPITLLSVDFEKAVDLHNGILKVRKSQVMMTPTDLRFPCVGRLLRGRDPGPPPRRGKAKEAISCKQEPNPATGPIAAPSR